MLFHSRKLDGAFYLTPPRQRPWRRLLWHMGFDPLTYRERLNLVKEERDHWKSSYHALTERAIPTCWTHDGPPPNLLDAFLSYELTCLEEAGATQEEMEEFAEYDEYCVPVLFMVPEHIEYPL